MPRSESQDNSRSKLSGRSLHDPKPFVPSADLFADGAHHAAYLALLDGSDRLKISFGSSHNEERSIYSIWAHRSLRRVEDYLAQSNVEKGPMHGTRPEYSRFALTTRAQGLQLQAEAILRECGLAPRGERVLPILIFGGGA